MCWYGSHLNLKPKLNYSTRMLAVVFLNNEHIITNKPMFISYMHMQSLYKTIKYPVASTINITSLIKFRPYDLIWVIYKNVTPFDQFFSQLLMSTLAATN